MHVAQFVHRYPPALGGAEAYAARLTEYLRVHGDTVDVWTTTAVELEEFWTVSRDAEALRSGARPRSLAPLRKASASRLSEIKRYQPLTFPLRRYLLKALTFLPSPWLRSFVLPCNPICPGMWRDAGRYDGPLDAVHAMAFPYAWPILCARRLARLRKVPFLLTPFLHLGDERTKKQYTQPALAWILKDADAVFVQTKLERDACLELGVKPERVILQGLGVDTGECTGGDRERFRKSFQIGDDEVVIGHLANLSEEKGSVDLLRACEMLWSRGVKVKVVLAGPAMANFRSYIADHNPRREPWESGRPSARASGCNGKLMVPGPLSEDEKKDFYAGVDIFALPSRCDSFGLVLLEAWANGVPNVAYRAGGPGEIIRHNQTGLLVACGDLEDLAQGLQSMVENQPLRQRLGQAGRLGLGDFDWRDKLEIVRQRGFQAV